MKKIYNAPFTKVAKLHPINMIAGSPTLTSVGRAKDNGITEADSRNDRFWDDEDEEEDY